MISDQQLPQASTQSQATQSSLPVEYLLPTQIYLSQEAYGHIHAAALFSGGNFSCVCIDSVLPAGPQPETTNATKIYSARYAQLL
jgi:hypothetical protein